MNINIHKTDVITSEDQEKEYLNKINDVCRFLKGLCPTGHGDLDLARTTVHHQEGKVYAVKIKLVFPGQEFFIQEESESLDAAFNIVKDRLEEDVRRYKDKLLTSRRKRGRVQRIMKGFRFWK